MSERCYTNAMSRGNTAELFFKILDVPCKRVELNIAQ